LEFLAVFSARLAEMPDFDTTLNTAVTEITHFLDAEAGALFLMDDEGDGLTCRASAGQAGFVGARATLGQGVVGRGASGQVIEYSRTRDPECDFPAAGGGEDFAVRSILCAPLGAGDQCVGTVALLNKRGGETFAPTDRHLLLAAAGATASAISGARLAENHAEQERVRRELELAAEIQRNLLPSPEPGAFPVVGINQPIREVSGDFYDFFRLPNGHIPFALGDVSGKGMNAALLMAKAASLFRCLGKSIDDPAALLKVINREIYDTASRGMFVTMVAGIYEPWTGRLRFANAGHEPPLLRRADRSYLTFLADAPPLGILPSIHAETNETNLETGEFYVFSDGLTEYRYGGTEDLGVEGLIQLVEASNETTLDGRLRSMLAELDQSGWELRDDLTVLAIDGAWTPPEGDDSRFGSLLSDAAPEALLELRVPARADRLKLLRPGVQAAARMCDFDEEEVEDIVLAVGEACQNVILHAYNGDADGDIVVEIFQRDDGILVRLRDFAPPIDPTSVRPRDLDDLRPGGLGTHFIREIMDSAEFREIADGSGNVLEMVKRTR
jgi:sigma-B regulation protein RsbU (phosphoserine phosphatase)